MRPKDKCPYDIDLHRQIWLQGYYMAIHDAMEWVDKNAYKYVWGDGHMATIQTIRLLLDFENELINGEGAQ